MNSTWFASALLIAANAALGCGTPSEVPPDGGDRDATLPDAGPGDADPGDAGPQVEVVGDETLVAIERGSLVSERPVDDASRFEALVSYLRDERARFGADGVAPEALTFVEAVAQSQITDEVGQTYTVVSLHQAFMGAPVIDDMQMGLFASTPDGDELRRVRAHLRDPGTLPPPPDPAGLGRVEAAAADIIATYELSFDATTVDDEPVILAGEHIAGYAVSQFLPSEAGSLSRFRAVVDPGDLRAEVVIHQPACDASRPAPVDEPVVDVPHTGFEIPGLTDLRFIRVQAVVLSDDDGSNESAITNDQIRIWVDEANELWTPFAKIVLLFDEAVGSEDVSEWSSTILNTPPADEAEDGVYSATANLVAKVLYPHRLVIFFRKRGSPGWSWGPMTDFFISMPEYTTGGIWKPLSGGLLRNDRLLAHELGHYLGLAHTFFNRECSVLTPTNSDGDTGGQLPNDPSDDVLDTNADLSDVCYPTDSLMCVGGSIVYNDLSWDPPWNNIMSYHDCFPQNLTDGQIAVVNDTLTDPNRSVLLVE